MKITERDIFRSIFETSDNVYEVLTVSHNGEHLPIAAWFVGGIDDMPSTMVWSEKTPLPKEEKEYLDDDLVEKMTKNYERQLAAAKPLSWYDVRTDKR